MASIPLNLILHQLLSFAERNPGRVEHALEAMWQADPHLIRDIAVEAVQGNLLTIEEGANWLGISVTEFESHVTKAAEEPGGYSTIGRDPDRRQPAKLARSGVAVWEIVREYRKEESLSRLQEHYASISHLELFEALLYAEEHPEEINADIERYEQFVRKKSEEYPRLGQE